MSLKLSIVYITYRPGGYDMLADSLKRQTYKDYELIIVDDLLWRHSLARDYLEMHGISVAYLGPSKKPCFPELAFKTANAFNTGILKSTGDVVVVMCDYQWYPPDSLAKWLRWEDKFKEKTCVVAGGDMYEDHRNRDLTGTLSIWYPHWKGDALENKCTFAFTWMPELLEMAYTAFPYELLEEINGIPECCDCFNGLGFFEPIVEKIYKVGGSIVIDKENKMQMVNHREWKPAENWHESKRDAKGLSTEFILQENCFDLKNRELKK